MLLGGLWHGAAWNYVLWGALHGGMLAVERRRGKSSPYQSLPRVLRVGLTFGVVLVSWVFFRARDLSSAVAYLGSMAGLGKAQAGADLLGGILYQPYYVLCMGAAALVVWAGRDTWEWTQCLTWPKVLAGVALLWLALAVLATQEYNPFIYFIF
jgi:alginate O-acetyltransferase complex protein AlgI